MDSEADILSASAGGGHTRLAFGYGLMIAAVIVGYLLIRSYGEQLAAPPAPLALNSTPA